MTASSIAKALTIAGSDSGGGAGIQADLKTFSAFGVHGMTVLTAVTAQNTLGVQAAKQLPPDLAEAQLRSVVSDIGVDALKTGMLSSESMVHRISDLLEELGLPNLVVDPVMIAKGGYPLLDENAQKVLRDRLLPLATVVTPNLPEATALVGRPVRTIRDMREAAQELASYGPSWVVLKGGHLGSDQEAIDVVYNGSVFDELISNRIETKNTHGTGCTFSAAIVAGLAKGKRPDDAIRDAKGYVTRAIEHALDIGSGHGPTNHHVGLSGQW